MFWLGDVVAAHIFSLVAERKKAHRKKSNLITTINNKQEQVKLQLLLYKYNHATGNWDWLVKLHNYNKAKTSKVKSNYIFSLLTIIYFTNLLLLF